MSRVSVINLAALAAALLSAVALSADGDPFSPKAHASTVSGPDSLADATGHRVPLAHYERILSAGMLSDRLLLDLCEPGRIVGFSDHSTERSSWAHRFAGKPTVADLGDLEQVLELAPDLVLVNHIGDPRRVARLREHGLDVFDLGAMKGLRTLVSDIREVATLLGHPERGERYVARLVQRLRAVAADIPPERRRRALYVSIHGTRLYGGTRGTSYHDMLRFAGLVDVAAARDRGWPAYDAEDLLALDPPLVVTGLGMRERLCRHPGLGRLRACRDPQGIIELPDGLLSDPGPGMLAAAERLRRRVYGPPRTIGVLPRGRP